MIWKEKCFYGLPKIQKKTEKKPEKNSDTCWNEYWTHVKRENLVIYNSLPPIQFKHLRKNSRIYNINLPIVLHLIRTSNYILSVHLYTINIKMLKKPAVYTALADHRSDCIECALKFDIVTITPMHRSYMYIISTWLPLTINFC